MSFFSHKEEKSSEELSPLYQVPAELAEISEIQLDEHTKRYIRKGDDKKWSIDNKAETIAAGQRYVAAFFIKDKVARFRALPSFNYVLKTAEDEEKFQLLKTDAKRHFECQSEDDVIFPNDRKWTGVVHSRLFGRILDLERNTVNNATIAYLSFYKKDGMYEWENRSANNEAIFKPDPLALACYVFDEDCIKHPNPDWDLYYHIQRSIPENFFRSIAARTTKNIAADETKADFRKCHNFKIEKDWERIRGLFKTNRAEAEKEIQAMLMRNLYIYLLGLSAKESRERAVEILKKGFQIAAEKGIFIDIDAIPLEFNDQKSALEIADEFRDREIFNFLNNYKQQLLLNLIKNMRLAEANELLLKKKRISGSVKYDLFEFSAPVHNILRDEMLFNMLSQHDALFEMVTQLVIEDANAKGYRSISLFRDLFHTIEDQRNPEVQVKLHIILVDVLVHYLKEKNEEIVQRILLLTAYQIKVAYLDIKKLQNSILKIFADNYEDKKFILKYIEYIFNKKSAIGQQLLESQEFRTKLEELREESTFADNFQDHVLNGNFEKAKAQLRHIHPKEKIFSLISNPFMQHLAGILLDEKPDFSKRNVDGKTLLQLTPSIKLTNRLINCLSEQGVNNDALYDDLFTALEKKDFKEATKILSFINTFNIEKGSGIIFLIQNLEKKRLEQKSFNEHDEYYAILEFIVANTIEIKLVPFFLKLGNFEIPLEKVLGNLFTDDRDDFAIAVFTKYVDQIPDFYATDLKRFDDKIIKKISELIEYNIDFLDVVLNKIQIQKNVIIQSHFKSAILSVVLKMFEDSIRLGGYSDTKMIKLLELKDKSLVIEKKYAESIVDKFIEFLANPLSTPSDRIKIINAVTHPDSVIGSAILNAPSGVKLKSELFAMKKQADNVKQYNEFINIGDLENAKKLLLCMPKQEVKELEDPLQKHLAKILLDEKPNFNEKDSEGKTLLHLAQTLLKEWSPALVTKLLEIYQVDPNIVDNDGMAPLYYAINARKWENVKSLVLKGAKFQDKEYYFNPMDVLTQSPYNYEILLFFLNNHVQYSPIFVTFESDKIENHFEKLIKDHPAARLPDLFAAITKMIKSYDTSLHENLLKIVFNLFEDFLQDYHRTDIVVAFLKMTDLPVLPEFKFNLAKIRSLLSIANDPEIINAVLDPTSSIGKFILKSEPTAGHFASGSASFRDDLVKRKAEIERRGEKKLGKDV